MKNKEQIKNVKISKFGMFIRIVRTILYVFSGKRWFLRKILEITVDQLSEKMNSDQPPVLIDLRSKEEFYGQQSGKSYGHIPNAKNVPIMQLAANLENLSSFQTKEIITICPGGGMSLTAAEIMLNAGFTDVKSLNGGMDFWYKKGYPTTTVEEKTDTLEEIKPVAIENMADKLKDKYVGEIHKTLDVKNLSCPQPVLQSKKTLNKMKIGQVLEILTTDPGSKKDIPAWAQVTGQEVLSIEEKGSEGFRFVIKKQK